MLHKPFLLLGNIEIPMGTKRVVITIRLVSESEAKSNREIEEEIFEGLSKSPPGIPWFAEVEKVTVKES